MPVIARLVKVATPLELVVAVSAPPSVPPPVAIATVTTTPLWLTAFPDASSSWIAGCWANATPLCAELEGCVVTASWLAAPTLTVKVPLITPLSPGLVAARV